MKLSETIRGCISKQLFRILKISKALNFNKNGQFWNHFSPKPGETDSQRQPYLLKTTKTEFLERRCLRLTSTHNKRGCAILTKKVAPKSLGTYLKLRPKNPGTWNAKLSHYMRKLTTQIRKSLISTPRFSFTYFIKGFYYLTFVLWRLCREFKCSSTTISLSCDICSVFQN